jgi:hypothetical protein
LLPGEQRRSRERGILPFLDRTDTVVVPGLIGAIAINNSHENSLTDAELDQVAGGNLVAAVAVGAVLGVGILAAAVAVGDYVRHHTGKECVFK